LLQLIQAENNKIKNHPRHIFHVDHDSYQQTLEIYDNKFLVKKNPGLLYLELERKLPSQWEGLGEGKLTLPRWEKE
jgi:hypothetical protein